MKMKTKKTRFKLIFAGSGSAFTVGEGNFHSNMLLETEKGKRLLIDCGSDARFSLHELGLSYQDIDHVYISHAHADHAGGLEWLAISRYFDPQTDKPHLYLSQHLKDRLWNNTLSGGLKTLQCVKPTIETYFNVHAVGTNATFTWEGVKFQLIQTIHTMDGFALMPSFGLFFKLNGQRIFITTDTQHAPSQMEDYYGISDIIFQDCEMLKRKTGVHANYMDLKHLPAATRKKMWLYHYNAGKKPDVKKAGFLGLVKPKQVFEF